MGKSLYVKRSLDYNPKSKSYELGKEIVIGERDFEYDTTYTDMYKLSPDEARFVAQELFKLAEKIDGKNKRDRTVGKIRKNTADIAQKAKKAAMG